MNTLLRTLLAIFAVTILCHCSSSKKEEVAPTIISKSDPKYKNPYPAGTYRHFTAETSYPKAYDVWRDEDLLKKASPKTCRVEILLGIQRGKLFVNNEVALDYPISSGRGSFKTKTGSYRITEKSTKHASNLYGTIYNAEGKVAKSDADMSKDSVPEGGKFKGASMPYWMRLTGAGLGMHVGVVRRHPVSHGCIRTPRAAASIVYSNVSVGTRVDVRNS